jgi:hypothetical protein
MVQVIAKVLATPGELTHNFSRIWVQQQLVRIEPVTGMRFIRPMRSQTIDQTGTGAGKEAMKNPVIRTEQIEPLQFTRPGSVEQTKFNTLGVL